MKRYFKYLLLLLLIIMPVKLMALDNPYTYSKSVIIYDYTDNYIVYEQEASTKRSIASLTKMMTLVTAINYFENDNIDINDKVIITKEMMDKVIPNSSIAGLRVGDVVTYEDLCYAMMLPSGADAAIALATSLGGNTNSFVKRMNELATKIGLKQSHFVNVHGLDEDNHYSTASDVLKILIYGMNNDTFRKVYTTKNYMLSNGLKVRSTLYLYSKNISGDIERILGSKTGFTGDAGVCISTVFKSNNHDYLLVTLGAQNNEYAYHVTDALNIINYMDSNYEPVTLLEKNHILTKIKLHNAKNGYLEIKLSDDLVKVLPKDYDEKLFNYEYIGEKELYPTDVVNNKLGKVNYYYDNNLIGNQDIYLNEAISFNIIGYIREHLGKIIIYFIVALIILAFIIKLLKPKKRRKKKHF